MSMKLRLFCSCRLAVGLILVTLAGCGRGDQPELGKVTGKVTLEGEPLANVEIAFIPDVGRPSYATTDDDGEYDLNYIRDIQGAKVGKHKVLVRSGKVDQDRVEPVEVAAGANVIDIECYRSKAKQVTKKPTQDDDTEL